MNLFCRKSANQLIQVNFCITFNISFQVKFWKTKSKNVTLLNIVGDKSSVYEIIQKHPQELVGSYTRTVPLPLRGYPYLNYVGKKIFHLPGEYPSVHTWPSQFPEVM